MESLILMLHLKKRLNASDLECQIDVVPVEELEEHRLLECLDVLDANLGEIYTKVQGKDWKTKKVIEMREQGLVYVIMKDWGFVSLKIIGEVGFRVLYLYEIQLNESQRGKGLGTRLLNIIYETTDAISKDKKLRREWLDNNMEIGDDDVLELENGAPVITATALTVFSSNTNARRLYSRLGYTLMDGSPTDKILRGRVIEPDYYILERRV